MTVTNKQIAEVFRKAKRNVGKDYDDLKQNNKQSYICFAIINLNISGVRMNAAISVIEERLGGPKVAEFGTWLEKNCPEFKKIRNYKTRVDKLQAHRHAWLDLLIEEFSQK